MDRELGASQEKASRMRRILLWVLVAAFLWAVFKRFGEIERLARILAQGQGVWVVTAATLQIAYYLIYTYLYQSAFATVGDRLPFRTLLPLTFATIFVNATAPAGGAAGVALFMEDARRRGESAARTTAAFLLTTVTHFTAFILVLTAGLLFLRIEGALTAAETSTAVVMFIYVGGLAGILVLGQRTPRTLLALLGWVTRLANGTGRLIGRPHLVGEEWAARNAGDFEAAAAAIAQRPQRTLYTFAVAFVSHMVALASLYSLFMAFGYVAPLDILVSGYAMGFLFTIISPTPSGIGIVEAVMPAVYTSLGVNTDIGTVVVLSYRGLSFWLPMLIGFALLRQLKMFRTPRDTSLAQIGQVRLVAILTALLGVLNLLSAVRIQAIDAQFVRLTTFFHINIGEGGNIVVVLTGFALILLSYGLWYWQRLAWKITLGILILSVAGAVARQADYNEAILSGMLAIYLIVVRSRFNVPPSVPAFKLGAAVLLAAVLFTLVYGTLGFYLLINQFDVNFTLGSAWSQSIRLFTQFSEPQVSPVTGFGQYFIDSVYIVGIATVGSAIFLLLRPALVRPTA